MLSLQYHYTMAVLKLINNKRNMAKKGEAFDEMMRNLPEKQRFKFPENKFKNYHVEKTAVHNRDCYRIKKKGKTPSKAVIYFFGGGFIAPPSGNDFKQVIKIINHLDVEIIIPFYPLLPNVNFSKICEAGLQTYELALEDYEAKYIQIIGFSAGASLCLYIFSYMKKTNRNLPYPNHMMLCSPAADVPPKEKELRHMYRLNKYDRIMHPAFMVELTRYMNEEEFKGLSTTINFDMTGLCPFTIMLGTREIFYAYLERFIDVEKQYNLNINYIIGEKMCHCWPLFGNTKEGKQGFNQMIKEMQYHFKS
ncbi:alpha/beta hydrolase [Oceanobacillus neutriphilus]|uniref:Alpha/beta hydrolase fold-3 domain-containing protein n=1 Tax=Oceanobacillus neutriphilus TaxID=531815 RepID=A0ABQ2NU54_9BACI|nr:alpha/beta hydrolase [Oceanobacillus neutriphilus]GGP10605.1 hypothetical protein GCM10011346_19400 [Oceanobacillus neutriphilus]